MSRGHPTAHGDHAPPSVSFGVHRVPIGALHSGVQNCLVVGVVLAKHDSRCIQTRAGTEKRVAEMTLRDSPEDLINVTCWLEDDFAQEWDDQFHLGDVIELVNPRVQGKDELGPQNERYLPQTSSPFHLTYSPPHSKLYKHSSSGPAQLGQYQRLLQLPSKPSCTFTFTLCDLQQNPRLQSGDHVDVLAAVRSVGNVRSFNSKTTGQERVVREVRLFDQTANTLILKLWDRDWVAMADQWTPMREILFLADVRVDRDEYWQCNIVTATGRTIISVNPPGEDSRQLAHYASRANLSLDAQTDRSVADVDYRSVRRVANVVDVQEMLLQRQQQQDGQAQPVAVIVYGQVTRFDVDADLDSCIQRRCSECRRLIFPAHSRCTQADCLNRPNPAGVLSQFNAKMDVTDVTGTLTQCRLSNESMRILTCPLESFVSLTTAERTAYKWQICLQPAKIWLLVLLPTAERRTPSVVVLHCEKIMLEEWAANSPVPPVH